MREAEISRKTAETDVKLRLNLDGRGKSDIATGVGFLDHMLTLFAAHGMFDLAVRCDGDNRVDDHHSAEDIAIALGTAFRQALGGKEGITRYGSMILPMDEALLLAAVDLSGRSALGWDAAIPAEKVGTFDTELVREFFCAFVREAGCALHVRKLAGENSHHIIEGIFKAVSRALRQAVSRDEALGGAVPSTKGVLL